MLYSENRTPSDAAFTTNERMLLNKNNAEQIFLFLISTFI